MRAMIRRATAADLGAVCEIERECFPASGRYPRELFHQLLSLCPSMFLVAELGGTVAGYAVGAVEPGAVGHILSLGVLPGRRRRGVGGALMAELAAAFGAAGIRRVVLEVRKGNAAAQAFYKRLGFAAMGEIPAYYEDGDTAAVMEADVR